MGGKIRAKQLVNGRKIGPLVNGRKIRPLGNGRKRTISNRRKNKRKRTEGEEKGRSNRVRQEEKSIRLK